MSKKKFERASGDKQITPVGTISYPKIFEPDNSGQYADGRYKCDLLLKKTDPVAKAWVVEQQKLCLELAKKSWPGIKPGEFKMPFRNGDEKGEEYEGHVFFTPKSGVKYKPQVVLLDPNQFADESQVYGGCQVRLSVFPYTYMSGGDKGVTYRLGNVQKISDGEAFGAARSQADDDFNDGLSVDESSSESAVDESTPFADGSDSSSVADEVDSMNLF